MADLQDTDYYLTRDTYLSQSNPDTNYGNSTVFSWGSYYDKDSNEKRDRPMLYTDISALSAGRVVRAAKLHLYVGVLQKDVDDDMTGACDSRRVPDADDDWPEDKATWNKKDKDVPTDWSIQPGNGVATPYPETQDGPTTTGWFEYIVTTIAAYAHKTHNGVFDLWCTLWFYFEDRVITIHSDEGTNRPFLRVTHEPKGRQVFM